MRLYGEAGDIPDECKENTVWNCMGKNLHPLIHTQKVDYSYFYHSDQNGVLYTKLQNITYMANVYANNKSVCEKMKPY